MLLLIGKLRGREDKKKYKIYAENLHEDLIEGNVGVGLICLVFQMLHL